MEEKRIKKLIHIKNYTSLFQRNMKKETHMKIQLTKNGPIVIHGGSYISKTKGEEGSPTRETIGGGTLALCRCGQSKRKPFCDGSHGTEFVADGGEIDIE
jgi:CDGSH-type Zn-finger protein